MRADIEAGMLGAVDAIAGLGERIRSGRREERFYGATQLPNLLRTSCGPGWALVGDAGYEQRRDEATLGDYHVNLGQIMVGSALRG